MIWCRVDRDVGFEPSWRRCTLCTWRVSGSTVEITRSPATCGQGASARRCHQSPRRARHLGRRPMPATPPLRRPADPGSARADALGLGGCADQCVDQLLAGRQIIPGDRWLTRIGVIMSCAVRGDDLGRTGDLTTDLPDRADHWARCPGWPLHHRARGIQRPSGAPCQRLRWVTTALTASKIRFGRSEAPVPNRST